VDIPEVVQATFYTMIAAYVEELSVLPAVMGGAIEEALGNLYWFSFEGWLDIHKKRVAIHQPKSSYSWGCSRLSTAVG